MADDFSLQHLSFSSRHNLGEMAQVVPTVDLLQIESACIVLEEAVAARDGLALEVLPIEACCF